MFEAGVNFMIKTWQIGKKCSGCLHAVNKLNSHSRHGRVCSSKVGIFEAVSLPLTLAPLIQNALVVPLAPDFHGHSILGYSR